MLDATIQSILCGFTSQQLEQIMLVMLVMAPVVYLDVAAYDMIDELSRVNCANAVTMTTKFNEGSVELILCEILVGLGLSTALCDLVETQPGLQAQLHTYLSPLLSSSLWLALMRCE
jgi:hypothetical protein